MLIRAEQMTAFEGNAEENFVRQIAAHLLEDYAKTIVRLPDQQATVDELPADVLHSLIRHSIERARHYGLDYESSIAAYSAVMFDVAPNFDKHRLSQVMLKDKNIEPNARLDELLETLSEKNWETIRGDYDVNAWQPETEEAEETKISEEAKKSDAAANLDFDETMRNFDNPKKSEKFDDDRDFLDTVKNY